MHFYKASTSPFLNDTSSYKYLDIVFTSRLYWSVPLQQTLSAHAEKALFALKRVYENCWKFPHIFISGFI